MRNFLESFGEWLINPCENLYEPILVRGENYFIGMNPDKTMKPDDEPVAVLVELTQPSIDKYVSNYVIYYPQLRVYASDFFAGHDFAGEIYDTFANISGVPIIDVDLTGIYSAWKTLATPPYMLFRDDMGRFVFVINMVISTRWQEIEVES